MGKTGKIRVGEERPVRTGFAEVRRSQDYYKAKLAELMKKVKDDDEREDDEAGDSTGAGRGANSH